MRPVILSVRLCVWPAMLPATLHAGLSFGRDMCMACHSTSEAVHENCHTTSEAVRGLPCYR